jgi:hypothetical protein
MKRSRPGISSQRGPDRNDGLVLTASVLPYA